MKVIKNEHGMKKQPRCCQACGDIMFRKMMTQRMHLLAWQKRPYSILRSAKQNSENLRNIYILRESGSSTVQTEKFERASNQGVEGAFQIHGPDPIPPDQLLEPFFQQNELYVTRLNLQLD